MADAGLSATSLPVVLPNAGMLRTKYPDTCMRYILFIQNGSLYASRTFTIRFGAPENYEIRSFHFWVNFPFKTWANTVPLCNISALNRVGVCPELLIRNRRSTIRGKCRSTTPAQLSLGMITIIYSQVSSFLHISYLKLFLMFFPHCTTCFVFEGNYGKIRTDSSAVLEQAVS